MKTSHGYSHAMRKRIHERDSYTCQGCGLVGWPVKCKRGFVYHTPIERVYLSVDHFIPRSVGGSDHPSNLRTLCTDCNTVKGTRIASWEYV